MFNVGLTQHPARIAKHLRDWQFLTRMVVANFLVVPGVMLLFIIITGIGAPYSAALILFACAAGAPLLIKLTQESDNDIAAGATVQMVLMVSTVGFLPFLLPRLIDGIEVDVWQIAQPLLLQMILPLALGMVCHVGVEKLAATMQPWVAKISNLALYGLLIFTIIGYLPEMADVDLWIAIIIGVVVLLIAFYMGYGTGQGNTNHAQLGALGTAQRNTLMMFVLLKLATRLGNDSAIAFLEPLEADMPGGITRPYAQK
ncbi:bile acid:sodium symporter [Corynebacterium sanguinis]|nr:bile acid:sodium symporter [Corynebacterium sanguinis]MCT2251139.1 bile acid:sodium symporter [Corynebacterium sanguinis]